MSHRTVREPTEQEHKELKRMKRQEVGRVSTRAHIILLSSRGYSAPQISEIHDVTGPMVYKWMDRFDEEGPSGLYDRDREGRPPKIDEEVEQEIERLLEGNPTEEGENATRWTTDRIAEHLDRELDVDVHPETVRDALNRLDYSWTRPRRKLPPVDSEAYRKRLEAIVEAVSQAGPDASVLVEDETTIKRFPPLRRQWQPVGEQHPVMVPDSNEDFTLYGTLDLTSGATHARAYEKGRSDYTIQYLESLLEATTGEVLLIWDQAKWHTSKKVRRWLEKHDRIETHLLPVRSPETNPMEDLWRELKERVAACLERSLDTLLESARQYLSNLSGNQALRTAGLYIN
ncbi:IS630 family transposase [Salinibacter ruber]|uniref:Transposase n=2 Tax=Salinibacter ruber TaxID=146919 RepID=A0AAW5PCC2_9BACT|nr:IS630 family transposase [Salinibacter ruber]MCS4159607.1 transposase [Salinibacter ruber]MCS4223920.1 transposase [Salinibacter ruber]